LYLLSMCVICTVVLDLYAHVFCGGRFLYIYIYIFSLLHIFHVCGAVCDRIRLEISAILYTEPDVSHGNLFLS